MAVTKKGVGVGILFVLLLSLAGFLGCGGSDESPAGPAALGEEVDLSLYEPATFNNYEVYYSVTRTKSPIEAGVRFYAAETVMDYDSETGQDIEVECLVLEEEGETGNDPDVRYYRSGNYIYGVRTNALGSWGPLYRFVPRRQIAPDENPRLGSTFDSNCSCLTSRFIMFDTEYRQVESLRSWTTYVAVEDSITVPAGTFHNILKTKVRTRVATKQTLAADTTAVVGNNVTETTSYLWSAEGIGVVKITEDSNFLHTEKEMLHGKVAGVSYPRTTD